MNIHINYHFKEMNHIKDGVFKVSVERIIETSGCFSGLTLEVEKFTNIQFLKLKVKEKQ